jgi:alpha-L-fucosidase
LIDSTSKGGNFVLNVGPMANGEFPPEHVALIKTIGAWMDVNGEAIYGTTPAPECTVTAREDFTCYATKKEHSIYLHVLHWPATGGPCTVTIGRGDFVKGALLDARLTGLKLTSAVTGNETVLTFERPEKVDPYATVIKLTFEKDLSSNFYGFRN